MSQPTDTRAILKELWSRQQINAPDVNYDLWSEKRMKLHEISHIHPGCLFTVDVYKGVYDFASDNFADIFGFSPSHIRTIERQGDILEDRIHPDDRSQIAEMQINHGRFIYSLPPEQRNDFRNTYQFRMLNAKGKYVNVISRQQVLEQDRNGKAWIIMGNMDISPDQMPAEQVKHSVLNVRTGDVWSPQPSITPENMLTTREIEILSLIRQGLLSKEIANRLAISIHTVNNHRKNILAKLHANNAIEAIHMTRSIG